MFYLWWMYFQKLSVGKQQVVKSLFRTGCKEVKWYQRAEPLDQREMYSGLLSHSCSLWPESLLAFSSWEKRINVTKHHLHWPRERKKEGREREEGQKEKEGKRKGDLIQMWCVCPIVDNTFRVESPPSLMHRVCFHHWAIVLIKNFLPSLHPAPLHLFLPLSVHTLHVLYTPHTEYQPQSK